MHADIVDRPASGNDADAGAGTDAGTDAGAALGALRRLLGEGRYAQALGLAQSLLPGAPEDRDILYAVAVAQRHLGRVAEALATLARLEELYPSFSRLYQERGQCHVVRRSAADAIEAFEKAVGRCAALPASWMALEGLYRMTGRLEDAQTAAAHVAKLGTLPREVVSASALFADGDIYPAERMIRGFLQNHPDDLEGMRLLARIGIELDVLDDAEFLLESVLMLAPDYHAARYDYAVVLLKRHKHVRARRELDRLLAGDPNHRGYRTTDAAICMGFGEFEGALARYRALLVETPADPELHLSVAHALKTLGHTAEAIESYRAAFSIRPSYGEAYWSLANLKTYRFTDVEIERMRRHEAEPGIAPVDRYHLCFALGKALEDRGDYPAAFACYERGNSLKSAECRYRPTVVELNCLEQRRVCTAELFARRRGAGASDAAPIFVVGLPRSGSTLLEQILSSHSQVEGTMELGEIPRLVQDLLGRQSDEEHPRYPALLPGLPAEDLRRFGEQYLADTRCYRRSGKPRFIDKNPNNFRHLGLIHLMLPNARIIDARRDPMACCFGNFKQLFAVGQQFTYSLEHIARYYRSYVELMRHWDTVLPGKILRVHHEDVVNDLEGSVRRILDFCGLDFEPACLDFHKNRRQVNTASSEQVRRPIYRDGMDQWRHFEPYLATLRGALGPFDER
jgi:tetratricopeptide (TPR) repeat protein